MLEDWLEDHHNPEPMWDSMVDRLEDVQHRLQTAYELKTSLSRGTGAAG